MRVEAERVGERLEVLALIAAADEVDVHVEPRIELGDGLQEHVDVLLGGQAPDEQDAIRIARSEVGR